MSDATIFAGEFNKLLKLFWTIFLQTLLYQLKHQKHDFLLHLVPEKIISVKTVLRPLNQSPPLDHWNRENTVKVSRSMGDHPVGGYNPWKTKCAQNSKAGVPVIPENGCALVPDKGL